MVILIIDDEKEIRTIIGRCFAMFTDVDVEYASSFDEGSRKIASLRPQIAFIDIVLQDGIGLDLIRMVKEISPSNQVVIVTGESDIGRILEALELGAADYLTKPFDMKLLRTVISETVERSRRWYGLIRKELDPAKE